MQSRSSLLATGLILLSSLQIYAANTSAGVHVSVLVTAESKHNLLPVLTKADIAVEEEREGRSITDFKPAENGATQMLLLIDDSASEDLGTEIPAIKKFILSLPADTDIGVGYMHNGLSQMVSPFSSDHSQAANSIRLPEGPGGADVSPYDSLKDAIKKWPSKDGVVRKEVIMISSGVEGLGGGIAPENIYVNASIAAAQREGVIVYTIYNPGFGHMGHSLWRSSWGQNLLSQLSDETGGEMYWMGAGSAVSFGPYFADIMKRQLEQYILTFEARAEKRSGLQPVKIRSALKGVSLAAPDKIYVKASL